MGRALVLVAVLLLSAALIYMIAAPRLLLHPTKVGQPAAEAAPPGTPTSSQPPAASSSGATPSGPIPVPTSPEQRTHDSLESRRAPYYAWLRDNESRYLTDAHASPNDPATVCLYLTSSDEASVKSVIAEAVQPYAANYGFNHALIYVPSPSGSVDPYTRTAEATPDNTGQWHIFFE